MYVVRKIENTKNSVEVKFKPYGWLVDRYGYLAANIASKYNIPTAELNEILRQHGIDPGTVTRFEISKKGKTAVQLKNEIKKITRDMENLIQELEDKAKEIAERVSLEGWLWEEAEYRDGKFRPIK